MSNFSRVEFHFGDSYGIYSINLVNRRCWLSCSIINFQLAENQIEENCKKFQPSPDARISNTERWDLVTCRTRRLGAVRFLSWKHLFDFKDCNTSMPWSWEVISEIPKTLREKTSTFWPCRVSPEFVLQIVPNRCHQKLFQNKPTSWNKPRSTHISRDRIVLNLR